jgi:hypothetical protein
MVSSVSAWTLQYDYESQPVGEICSGFGSSQSVITGLAANGGSQSCVNRISAGQTGFGVWGGIVDFPSNLVKGDEIWVRIQTFWPAGTSYDSTGEGNHLKFLRVHTRSISNPNLGYNDWYISPSIQPFFSHEFIYEGDPKWRYVTDLSLRPQFDQWETYEYYLKLDNVPARDGGEARIRAWKNGALILDVDSTQTLTASGDFADRLHVFTYWNGASPLTQTMYIDDLFITTATPANVDASGNPYIGVAPSLPPPNPPSNIN